MKGTMLLCDFAQETGGKLHMIGAGWSRLTPDDRFSFALAIVLRIPWEKAGQRIRLVVELRDSDGRLVEVGSRPVYQATEVSAQRKGPRRALSASFAPYFHNMRLPAGTYEWVLIGNEEELDRYEFVVD